MKYLKSWNETHGSSAKVEIIVPKLSEKRKDSFWYYNKGDIASVTNDGVHFLTARATGEISLAFSEDGDAYKNASAIERAEELNINDIDLNNLGSKDLFFNNNWFTIEYYNEEKDESIDIDSSLPTDYDDAIEEMKEALEDDEVLDKISEICGCKICQRRKHTNRFDL